MDGSRVGYRMGFKADHVFPAGGTFVIGNSQTAETGMTVEKSYSGSLSRVNIWNYVISGETLWAMSKGPLFENGNIFAWYGIKKKSFGDVRFEETPDDLNNSSKYSIKLSTVDNRKVCLKLCRD